MSRPIETWDDWPDDVVVTLRQWNHITVQRLRFERTGGFACHGERIAPNRYGDAKLDGRFVCDNCLIETVRPKRET